MNFFIYKIQPIVSLKTTFLKLLCVYHDEDCQMKRTQKKQELIQFLSLHKQHIQLVQILDWDIFHMKKFEINHLTF